MKKLFKQIKKNKIEFLILLLIFSLAAFLRFYKINELHFFTYDQARDDLIVKRILVDHQWTLLGPQSSMPGVYLPPFYYYTLVPILWLSGLNPVGVDIYTALIGLATVLLVWYVCRQLFGSWPALMAGALYATAPLIVELSHRAWNPNTQPFFVLLTLWFWYQLLVTRKEKYLLFSSFSFGYAVNLHFGALCLILIWLFLFLWSLIKLSRKILILLSGLVLFLFGAPLILFDLRHQWMLTNNIYQYFFAGQRVSLLPAEFLEPMLASVFQLFVALLSGNFVKTAQVPFEFWGQLDTVLNFAPVSIIAHKPLLVQFQWWGIVLLGLIVLTTILFFLQKKKNEAEKKVNYFLYLLLGSLLVSALISRFYIGKFYFFYYLFIFVLPFLFLGFAFWFFWRFRQIRLIIAVAFLSMFGFNLKHALVFEPPERTINDIQRAAEVIAVDEPENLTFNIAANYRSIDRWDHNAVDYRYFLEAYYDKRALNWQPEDYEKAEILYVVAEGGMPNPVAAQIMEIYKFEPKEILNTWTLSNGVVIYKLGK